MKRMIFMLLTLCLMIGLLAVTASAAPLGGTCSQGNIAWLLDDDGTITFTGEGFMEGEFTTPSGEPTSLEHYGWMDYKDQIRKVVINEGVISVGGDSFSNCDNLTEVVLPDSMQYIEENAFMDCDNLTSIDLPTASDLYICEYAFSASGLTEIILPDNVTDVEPCAFSNCKSLTRAKLSNNQFYILRESMFQNCTALTEIDFGTSISRIAGHALYNTGFTELVFPDTVTFLDDHAVAHCKALTTLDLGDGIAFLNDQAFMSCSKLKTVTVGTALSSICRYAFKSCDAIEELYIPDLELWCKVEVEYTESSPVFYADRVYVDGVLLEDFVMPEDLMEIDMYAFEGAGSLKTVTINDQITSFRGFGYCPNLTEVTIGSSVVTLGDGSFRSCPKLTKVVFKGSAPVNENNHNGSFYQCTATCYYPANDPTWTEEQRNIYWSGLTWVPYDPELGVGNPFTDVPLRSFYYDPVMWAVDNGITNGLSASEFGPNAACNRAQIVTFLWRAAGSPEPTATEHPFVDVESGSFYEKAVLWAVEKGITTGTDDTHFSPNMRSEEAHV